MAYKNTLKDSLKMVSVTENKDNLFKRFFCDKDFYETRYYELSHNIDDFNGDLDELEYEDLKKYIIDYYINNDNIYKGDILNDLVVFKTYRDNLQLRLKHYDILINLSTILIAYSSLYTAIKLNKAGQVIIHLPCNKSLDIVNLLGLLGWFGAVLSLIIFCLWNRKDLPPNKINNINNTIYILEAFKEDMYHQEDEKCKKYTSDYREDIANQISDRVIKSFEIYDKSKLEENGNNKIGFILREEKSLKQISIKDISVLAVIYLLIKKLTNKKK